MHNPQISIKQITHEQAVSIFQKPAAREDMAGWSEKAIYYAVIVNGVYAGVSSIQYWSTKVKFNNHYVFPEYRGNGLFKMMFDYIMLEAKKSKGKYIEATCTSMSIDYYVKNGFEVIKEFKKFYGVKKTL